MSDINPDLDESALVGMGPVPGLGPIRLIQGADDLVIAWRNDGMGNVFPWYATLDRLRGWRRVAQG